MPTIPITEFYRGSLPPELILDNFIQGFESSYEDYLADFVNESKLFAKLSGGKEYYHLPKNKQSHGECDCWSEKYSLDFKIFGAKSSLYASRNLSLHKVMPCPGVIMKGPPEQSKDMDVALTNGLLRAYDLDDLIKIDGQKFPSFDRDHLCPEAEVKAILKGMKYSKNVLYFYKDFIFTEREYAPDESIKSLEPYMNDCFSNVFRFREQAVPDMDTFFAVITQGHFCLAVWDNTALHFKEFIPLSCSHEFMRLYEQVDDIHKVKLIVR